MNPHTDIIIRPIKKLDIPPLLKIGGDRAKAPLEKGGLPWGLLGTVAQRRKSFEEDLKKEGKSTITMVAEYKGKAIGFCSVTRDMRKHRAHVADMGTEIDYSYQNMGIGGLLKSETIKTAKRSWKSLELIEASVSGCNKQSIRASEKFGFRRVAEIPNNIKWKGKYYPKIIIQLKVR